MSAIVNDSENSQSIKVNATADGAELPILELEQQINNSNNANNNNNSNGQGIFKNHIKLSSSNIPKSPRLKKSNTIHNSQTIKVNKNNQDVDNDVDNKKGIFKKSIRPSSLNVIDKKSIISSRLSSPAAAAAAAASSSSSSSSSDSKHKHQLMKSSSPQSVTNRIIGGAGGDVNQLKLKILTKEKLLNVDCENLLKLQNRIDTNRKYLKNLKTKLTHHLLLTTDGSNQMNESDDDNECKIKIMNYEIETGGNGKIIEQNENQSSANDLKIISTNQQQQQSDECDRRKKSLIIEYIHENHEFYMKIYQQFVEKIYQFIMDMKMIENDSIMANKLDELYHYMENVISNVGMAQDICVQNFLNKFQLLFQNTQVKDEYPIIAPFWKEINNNDCIKNEFHRLHEEIEQLNRINSKLQCQLHESLAKDEEIHELQNNLKLLKELCNNQLQEITAIKLNQSQSAVQHPTNINTIDECGGDSVNEKLKINTTSTTTTTNEYCVLIESFNRIKIEKLEIEEQLKSAQLILKQYEENKLDDAEIKINQQSEIETLKMDLDQLKLENRNLLEEKSNIEVTLKKLNDENQLLNEKIQEFRIQNSTSDSGDDCKEINRLKLLNTEQLTEIHRLNDYNLKLTQDLNAKQTIIENNHNLLRIRCELIAKMQTEQDTTKHSMDNLHKEIAKYTELLEHLNTDISIKAEESQNLFSTLGIKQLELNRQDHIIHILQVNNKRNQMVRIGLEERCAKLEEELLNKRHQRHHHGGMSR